MITVNGIVYKAPEKPTVIICIDGCEPAYLDRAAEKHLVPAITGFRECGFSGLAKSVIPSFTNPNNAAIITGAPPKVNGIPGNWVYDEKTGTERALESPDDLKCETILQAFSERGIKVAAITAKDKLRLLLGKGLKGIGLSAEMIYHLRLDKSPIESIVEQAAEASARGIIATTDNWMYSERSSEFTLELAVKLVKSRFKPDLIYVSLTDYMQHRYAPGSDEASGFYHEIDILIGQLDGLGCVIGITGDHGMNDKHNSDGSPKVLWLDALLRDAGISKFKTILPITDKYGAHHGSLGGLAWIHLEEVEKAIALLSTIPGIDKIYRKPEAAEVFGLPPEFIGDIVLLGDRSTVFGTSIDKHGNIPAFLRSHGSLHEQTVPFILNRKLNEAYSNKAKEGLRNFNIFEYTINGVEGNLPN